MDFLTANINTLGKNLLNRNYKASLLTTISWGITPKGPGHIYKQQSGLVLAISIISQRRRIMYSVICWCFLTTMLVCSMPVFSLEDPQGRHVFTLKRSTAQQFQHQLSNTDIPRIKKQFSEGISARSCTPPAGQICCNNFRYDILSNSCRRLA
ncbi:hypothetical protein TNCT_113711 [Trichonephila clavata]|uniref:Uncharacterized protein n=1 Tax=Trichonephila clavata TaxID=2740835 RepID=A0A8X6FH60_TRICU|nr:hypothetical protein TNCT_113711 [Trichonephila clavata]